MGTSLLERRPDVINLYGAYTHNIDAKGRLSLPAKFREKLPGYLVAMVDISGRCLYVFDEEGFDDYVAQLFEHKGGYNPRSMEDIELRSQLMERAVDVSIDSAGRINLPANLRTAVGLDKEVQLIGNAGYFEIWDVKRREQARAAVNLADLLEP
ncbi:MAG: division/cell wall cluster transcriptional repressor MraZ [Eggerthellaceae bacterium]|nr:division/cell wall cluster transcriptional repressor MraZ [Eggerthellaceae bacterium]